MGQDLHGITFNGDLKDDDSGSIMTTDGLIKKVKDIRENQWTGNSIPNGRFVVKVDGNVISAQYQTLEQAQRHLQGLPTNTQVLAEITQVDIQGNELLLG